MFHYGLIGNNNRLVKDLLSEAGSIKQKLISSTEITRDVKQNSSLVDSPFQDTEKTDKTNILNLKSGWLNSDLTESITTDESVLVRCNCSSCCNGFIPEVVENSGVTTYSLETVATDVTIISQEIIDSLLSGFEWPSNTTTITYSFYEDDVFNGSYYGDETGVREVSEGIKSSVREVLNLVETFLDIDFIEVAETNTNTFGEMRYMLSNAPNYAYAYLPFNHVLGSDVHLSPSFDNSSNTNGFQSQPGSHGYTTLIHETFHALGLTHPQDDTVLDPALDNKTTTVMTYDFKNESSPATAMPYDIAALQYLYGAATHNGGNTTYEFGLKTDQFTVNGTFPIFSNSTIKQTIWDSGGIDTLDFSNLQFDNNGYLFNLNQGGWLVANSQDITQNNNGYDERYYRYGTSLAYGMTIENVINSSSNDRIVANTAANIFSGYNKGTIFGNDTLVDTNQSDTLDLSSYDSDDLTQTRSGNDLVIDLGNDGSVTIDDYYLASASQRLQIDVTEVFSGIAIAEFGKITDLDHNEQTITLQNDYTNPVIFAQPLSYGGSDPSIVRITDISADTTTDTISFYLQEAEYKNGIHSKESFSYMVVEAGTWQLEDGTLLEVGTLETGNVAHNGWSNVDFSNNFSETPVVMSQVQTNRGAQFVRTRQKDASANGFSVTMEEEEALSKSGHARETIGWLAMSGGSGTWDGYQYLAGSTGKNVDHNWYELDFNDFATTPNLMGSIATYAGSDPSGLRYRELAGANGSTIEIKIEEDRSKDNEVRHAKEEVNFLAIEGSGILTAEAYNPAASSLVEDSLFEVEAVDIV